MKDYSKMTIKQLVEEYGCETINYTNLKYRGNDEKALTQCGECLDAITKEIQKRRKEGK